jgi:predicted RNA-binding protein with PUA-like domain
MTMLSFALPKCRNIGVMGIVPIINNYYADASALNSSSTYYDKHALIDNRWLTIYVKFQ